MFFHVPFNLELLSPNVTDKTSYRCFFKWKRHLNHINVKCVEIYFKRKHRIAKHMQRMHKNILVPGWRYQDSRQIVQLKLCNSNGATQILQLKFCNSTFATQTLQQNFLSKINSELYNQALSCRPLRLTMCIRVIAQLIWLCLVDIALQGLQVIAQVIWICR